MTVAEFIRNLDSSELANLLCIIYNIGLFDSKKIDRSDFFSEEFMNSDNNKLHEFLDSVYKELFR